MNSVPQTDAAEKESLIISSGTYPDVFIFSSLGKDNIDRYGSEGVFVPLEDYIRTYAPNLTALLDERELWPSGISFGGFITPNRTTASARTFCCSGRASTRIWTRSSTYTIICARTPI
ncbi:MAG: hypothetical protein HFH97_12765 [Lachnospiraceae bacterium]|nr:hypothetical protein [Lachnospiraceae bacterium]